VKKLADITLTIMRGISPKYLEEGGICVLNQKCIRDKSINFDLSRRHNHEFKSAASKLIEFGDILVNSTGVGTLGRVALVKRLKEPITTVDSHVTIVRGDDDKINKLFLGYSLTEKQNEIEVLGIGSTGQTELSRVDLGKLPMVIPPNDLQLAFDNLLKPQLKKMTNNEQQNQQLTELRDWLLPMLMNSQVKVQ
jgi:type I restriction enzyme S subunit